MRIAIIGGGWVGCHLAYKFKDIHQITLYEKNKNLFEETSYNNQNRLHLGFHYSRSSKTRNLCKNTFNRFIGDYGDLTMEIPKNLYCIPKDDSIIDYETFKQIFTGYETSEVSINLKKIEGCVNTKERFIDFKMFHNFFNQELSHLIVEDNITKSKLKKLKKSYDLVINCTNNHIKDETFNNSFYELTLILIYEKINNVEFDALTLIDGKLFSIYPYQDNNFTITDVEYTPIKKFNSVKRLNNYVKKFNDNIVKEKKELIEAKIKKYYSDILTDFRYKSYILSTKSKIINLSDDRSPIINKTDNYVSCFTGKIQGIYLIEDYLKKEFNL
jgi:major membrane immunogen (membrane-anchored lipoprotein)